MLQPKTETIKGSKKPQKRNILRTNLIKFPKDNEAIIIIASGKFEMDSNAQKVITGTVTKTRVIKAAVPAKKVVINIDLPVSDDPTQSTTFDPGKADITDKSKKLVNDLISNAVKTALKNQGLEEDMSKVKITGVKVIASASNTYGGIVPATHNNDGTSTEKDYLSGITDPKRKASATANYTLAQTRGNNLKTLAVIPALNSMGFNSTPEDANIIVEPRVTDTGGAVDSARTKAYPKPGQYARVELDAETVEIQTTEPEAEITSTSQTMWITSGELSMLKAKGDSLFDKIKDWSFGLTKAKYLKKSGEYKPMWQLRRNSGSKKAFSGFSHFVHNLLFK